VRIACVSLLAIAALVAGSASSSAAGDLHISLTGPSTNPVAGGAAFKISADVSNSSGTGVNSYTANITLPSGTSLVSSSDGCAPDSGNAQLIVCPRGVIASGGTDDMFAFTASAASNAAGNTTITPSLVSIDPDTVARSGTDLPLTVDGQADLQPSITAPSGAKIAGVSTGFDYTVKVHNAGPSDNEGGYTLTGTLPSDVVFDDPSGDCSGSGGSFTCSNSTGLAFGAADDSYTVHVKVLASACPGGTLVVPPCDGTVTATASVLTGGTTDPNPPGPSPSGDDAGATTSIVTHADLEAVSMGASNNHLFANTGPANTETFSYELTNHGPSDAQHVSVSLPDHPGGTTNPAFFIIDSVCRSHTAGDCASPPTGFSSSTDIGEVDANATVDVVIIAHANPALGHQPPLPIISGSFTFANTATVSSPTDDPGSFPNVRSNLSPNVTIDTVASPPRNPFGIPGTGNAILTWENPASNGGQTIQNFLITVTPPSGPSFTLPTVPFNASPTGKCGAVNASDCYQLTVSGLQNDHGAYTFAIQAQNAVGASDAATTTATPSVNAKNASVPTNTSTTLTTCTTATLATPVCVVYNIPSGAGGVFGAGGVVALPTGLCGINVPCLNNTGAQNLGSLAGYNDRTHPLIETITWDSSLVAPSLYTHVPACPNNSTSTTCYPNDVQIYYEDTFALLHCGVGFAGTCDPNTLVNHSLFPVVPATVLNMHFCALSIASGGAGNKNYARPKPSPVGIYNGYNDPSGSACIKSMNALGSASQNGANRDIQVVVNMTSDSDGLAGRH